MRTLLFLFLCLAARAYSQDPQQALYQWSKQNQIEKIYLHLDRENYIAGETIWFKAYLSSDQLPDTISTTLYVELIGPGDLVILRKSLPIVAATSRGEFSLPDSLNSAYYLLRAYTPAMKHSAPDLIFLRRVFIYGGKKKEMIKETGKNHVEFFPEGGNLVENVKNNLAFKISGPGLLPLNLKGKIFDNHGAIVGSIEPVHNGMGVVEMVPLAGSTYYAMLENDTAKYPVPAAVKKGIVFSTVPHPLGHFFEIDQNHTAPALRAAYMIGQMQNQPVFRQSFAEDQEAIKGLINTTKLHSGIMQVTVFNKNGYPLAERLCFVNNREYVQEASIVFDTLDLSVRGRNHFILKIKDTVQGSLSLSVTDPAFSFVSRREENIYSRFFLNSDLPGYIHDPAWYFQSDDDSVKQALDLLMMTNGWRRFKWTEILNNPVKPAGYTDHGFITVSGKAYLRGSKKPYANRPLVLMIYDTEKKRIIELTNTDKEGGFHVDSLLFFGKNRLLFADIRGKKSEYIDVVLDSDSLGKLQVFPSARREWFTDPAPGPGTAFTNDYESILRANGQMLENVNIRVTRKSAIEELEERYTKGPFSSPALKTIDLVHSDEATPYTNIFEYLQFVVNGLTVNKDGFDYVLHYRQQATVSSLGAIPMTLYLDEVETDASFIAAIPASQIALVKVYSNFTAATGNAPGGVLAIYTKQGPDFVASRGRMSFGNYQGYSITKEFYAPDHSDPRADSRRDERITLDWRPDIFLNYVDPSVPFSFFNNDRSKKFRIVIEGMTTGGKLICLEEVVGKE